ncbi:MAG: excinuclease ABC subunit UvrC [Deltaproteobacteria bacterium]|nr:excinuclease ABC subunit UvrC [Deltaproteobacteria bacterium]
MRDAIAFKLKTLPAAPGVYLMKDADGKVFYVGKAKSLRDRVRSYFSGSDARAFVAELDRLLFDLEVVLTHTEKEALILESDLIRTHRPRFNVLLTDDKRFPCLRLDLRQPYPRLEVVRRFVADGARYFGPYHDAGSIRETLRLVNRHFQLRTCSDHTLANRERPCLQYQLKRCPAPCVFDLKDGRYRANVDSVVAFLEGRQQDLVTALEVRMRAHAAAEEFEAAAVLRDQMYAVQRSLERQRVVSPDLIDRDIVGLFRQGRAVEISVLCTRQGRLVEAKRFSLPDTDVPTGELLADFAMRYYEAGRGLPREILLPAEMEWAAALAELLSEQSGDKVAVLVPKRGDKASLVRLAAKNAEQAFIDKERERGAAATAVERLQKTLRLRRPPERIECFDVSHLQGTHIVAAVVRFEMGLAHKDGYRHYNLRSLAGQDDFAAIYEVVLRRARRGVEDGDLPDLMVIDGGKGQLAAAKAALDDHGVDTVEVVGLAKARPVGDVEAASGTRRSSPERVFVLGHKNPVVLRQDSAELFLLTRARDEAHRFAIGAQRRRRRKAQTHSALDAIPGIGAGRRRALLSTFGSLAELRRASAPEIAAVVGEKLAAVIVAALGQHDRG